MTTATIPIKLTRKDFVSDQAVRWCPGCGDYSILAQVQKTLPDIGVPKENIVFISGIGCSSRFPYYMNTYGIHSIHGRAPTLATGLAISNPELSVWVITGDGDGLSIGGNHLIHALRRNVNLNIILFNNRIYGLTKGQYSPTSRAGHKTKSSPMGSIEQPLNPVAVALAAGASFVARSLDAHTTHLGETLAKAAAHKGSSFVEVFQNCVIFNPTEWGELEDRQKRDEHILYLEHGKPMVFGKEQNKGIRLNNGRLEVVELGNGITEDDLLVHDETSREIALLLSNMEYPDYPAVLGVIYNVTRPTYEEGLMAQIEQARQKNGPADLNKLYRSADLWTVSAREEVQSEVSGEVPAGLDEQYVDEIDKETAESSEVGDRLAEESLAALQPNVPISIDATDSLAKAIRKMNAHNIGCLLVTDPEDHLIGILTERDILMRVAGVVEDLTAAKVADYMTPNPIALKPDTPIAQALHEMSIHGFRHLPLVDEENRPEGIVSFRDIVHYLKPELS
ncbi:MAG: CBS domain-containing protein [Chloroflexi bacterium]|nr:MAG: CBS domain-containing protein [Chloroflexota bacterium]